ncbi:MAG TPA: hypothetical protein DCE41_15030 [Cytophagales bacterium]|nr:hypothetical protein [Cytophagales bacterium]HAA24302.1 hypothetical protein [Cytophagales bacterium]HAP59460.1 hypothetical protein [Cytophagales bacterium]
MVRSILPIQLCTGIQTYGNLNFCQGLSENLLRGHLCIHHRGTNFFTKHLAYFYTAGYITTMPYQLELVVLLSDQTKTFYQ